jgi:hypothetical protein
MPESGIRSDTPPLSPVSSLQQAVAGTLQRVLLGWNSGHNTISHNRADLIGRLTRDPEIRQTSKGLLVAHVGLAVNRQRTSGEETTLIELSPGTNTPATAQTTLPSDASSLRKAVSNKHAGVAQTEILRTRLVIETDHISLISHGSLIHATPIKRIPPQALAN